MRKLLLLLTVLAALAVPTAAAERERDFAVGANDALGYTPQLPAAKDTAKSLRDILARPEFNEQQAQTKGPSLLERILQWIVAHMGGLGAGLMGAGITTLIIAGIVIAAVLVLIVYLIVRAIWGRMSRIAEPDLARIEENLTAAGFRELARKSAAAGEYLPALRYRFKAVVGGLDVLDSERQTNWQLLRHVRRNHNAATADFAALIALFEDCWYGGRAAGAEDYALADQLASVIETTLAAVREVAA